MNMDYHESTVVCKYTSAWYFNNYVLELIYCFDFQNYGEGSGKDCRIHVQKLNSVRRDLEAEREKRLDDQLEEEEEEQDLSTWTDDVRTPVLSDATHQGVNEGESYWYVIRVIEIHPQFMIFIAILIQ